MYSDALVYLYNNYFQWSKDNQVNIKELKHKDKISR